MSYTISFSDYGATETIKVDVRILAATNKDLEEMVKAKTFREDLYYRLNVVRIRMPPLRDRGEDIPQIVDFCLQNLVKQKKTRVTKVSPEAMAVLARHNWPGNVRELENVVYRSAVIAQGDAILVKNLPVEIRGAESAGAGTTAPFADAAVTAPVAVESAPAPVEAAPVAEPALSLTRALDFVYAELAREGTPVLPMLEDEMVRRAMAAAEADVGIAAKNLGLTKAALQKKLKES